MLAGQSNAEGQALVYRTDNSPGTLDKVLQTDSVAASTFGAWAPTSRDASGRPSWPRREDVYVYYDSVWGLQAGALTAGFGAYGDSLHFGLEMEVGRLMGDFFDEPLLILKIAYGGKSLRNDFRPPSAGGTVGMYYTRLLENYRAALANVGTAFPSLAGLPVLPAGFVWWQGFNGERSTARCVARCVDLDQRHSPPRLLLTYSERPCLARVCCRLLLQLVLASL